MRVNSPLEAITCGRCPMRFQLTSTLRPIRTSLLSHFIPIPGSNRISSRPHRIYASEPAVVYRVGSIPYLFLESCCHPALRCPFVYVVFLRTLFPLSRHVRCPAAHRWTLVFASPMRILCHMFHSHLLSSNSSCCPPSYTCALFHVDTI
jgi:hypothetical protein